MFLEGDSGCRVGDTCHFSGGRVVELLMMSIIGNHFVASERIGFRNGPCHVEAITERSIKQMLISQSKFIGFWTENPEFIPGASPIPVVSSSRGELFPVVSLIVVSRSCGEPFLW